MAPLRTVLALLTVVAAAAFAPKPSASNKATRYGVFIVFPESRSLFVYCRLFDVNAMTDSNNGCPSGRPSRRQRYLLTLVFNVTA